MTPERINQILPLFVAKQDPREFLMEPFRAAGIIAASNGHILAAVPDDGRHYCGTAPEKNGAYVENLLSKGEATPAFDALPPLPELPDRMPCLACGGKGRVSKVECQDCKGRGEFRHGDHWYECKECDGEGMVRGGESSPYNLEPCFDCMGTGFDGGQHLDIGAARFAVRYLHILAEIGARLHVRGETDTASGAPKTAPSAPSCRCARADAMLSAQLAALSVLLFGAAVIDGATAPVFWLRLLAACSLACADLAVGLLFFGGV